MTVTYLRRHSSLRRHSRAFRSLYSHLMPLKAWFVENTAHYGSSAVAPHHRPPVRADRARYTTAADGRSIPSTAPRCCHTASTARPRTAERPSETCPLVSWPPAFPLVQVCQCCCLNLGGQSSTYECRDVEWRAYRLIYHSRVIGWSSIQDSEAAAPGLRTERRHTKACAFKGSPMSEPHLALHD